MVCLTLVALVVAVVEAVVLGNNMMMCSILCIHTYITLWLSDDVRGGSGTTTMRALVCVWWCLCSVCLCPLCLPYIEQ